MKKYVQIRGHRKLNLQRDLAAGTYTQSELAIKYDVTTTAISQFGTRYKDEIDAIAKAMDDEFAGLWIADKKQRIAEYESDVENINEHIHDTAGEPNPNLILRKHNALRSAAEELGQLTAKVESTGKLHYVVEGVDMDAL